MQDHRKVPHLRVIPGGLAEERRIGAVIVRLGAMEALVPDLDAVVVEDDTFRLLSGEPILKEPVESLDELERELTEFRAPAPGDVLVRGGEPLELVAIIHDLDQDPSWRLEWISSALAKVLALAAERQIDTLAMPLLGTVHGKLKREKALALLRTALEQHQAPWPRVLWLAVPRRDLPDTRHYLQRAAP